jgi:hypothetical protein
VKRTLLLALAGFAGIAFLFAQPRMLNPAHAPFEMLSVFPRETMVDGVQRAAPN